MGIWEQTEKKQLPMSSTGQQSIAQAINIMNEKDFKQNKKKFESTYFLAKKETPLSLFLKHRRHKEKHDVIVSAAYRSRNLVTLFLEYTNKNLTEELKKNLHTSNFYSMLTDGSTDLQINKKEAFFV